MEDILDDTVEPINPGSVKMTSRYRFRDLLLGDFAFNDDGERWVLFYTLLTETCKQKLMWAKEWNKYKYLENR